MKRIIFIALLLFSGPCFSEPIFYLSPGFQMNYSFPRTFSFGGKLSLGAYLNNGNIINITGGITGFNQAEFYAEIEHMVLFNESLPICGYSIGLSYLTYLKQNLYPRISLFGGYVIFANAIYLAMLPKEYNPFRIGSTIVLPLPLNTPKLSFPRLG
jgi:hypothetical protein